MSEPTLGVVTVLPEEFASVRAMLDDAQDVYRGSPARAYVTGTLPALTGERHLVVLVQLPDYGNDHSTAGAILMFQDFPSVITQIFCGIAGGVPQPDDAEKHVRLGDVVVSGKNGFIQCDLQKVKEDEIDRRPTPRAPHVACLAAAQRFQADHLEGKAEWIHHLNRGAHIKDSERPTDDTDILYDAHKAIPHPQDPRRNMGEPRVFLGTIGSGNSVVKNASIRDEWAAEFGLSAIEMESAGLADAAWHHATHAFVVRGICDYCDTHKNDTWHGYAALVAAAFLRALAERLPPLSRTTSVDPSPVPATSPPTREGLLRRLLRCISWHGRLLIVPAWIVLLSGCCGLLGGLVATRKAPDLLAVTLLTLMGLVVSSAAMTIARQTDHVLSKYLTAQAVYKNLKHAFPPALHHAMTEANDHVERCKIECKHA